MSLGGLFVAAGGGTSNLVLNGGSTVDLSGVIATSASVVSSLLVATSSGQVVEELSLNGGANLTFQVSSDGQGGTDLAVSVGAGPSAGQPAR